MTGTAGGMARRIREEYIDEAPVTRRRVVERRTGGYGPGRGMNPIAAVVAGILVVFILVLLFGYLL